MNAHVAPELKTIQFTNQAPPWVKDCVNASQFIANGTYCYVFAAFESEKVIKLSQAKAELDMLQVLSGKSRHYPVTYRRFDSAVLIRNSVYHALELERVQLAPDLKIHSLTEFLYLHKEYSRLHSVLNAAQIILDGTGFGVNYPKSLGYALKLLVDYGLDFPGVSLEPDLYTKINWGVRDDGELVIIDPMNFPPDSCKSL